MEGSESIFDLIKAEHRHVLSLLDELAETPRGNREAASAKLTRELERALLAEEEVLYPRLDENPKTARNASRAQDEHNTIRERLDAFEAMSPADSDWREGLQGLRAAIVAHWEHEEKALFDLMRAAFDGAALAAIAKAFTEAS